MKIWRLCLAAFLVLTGLLAVTNFQIQFAPFILGILAIAAGVLLVLDR